MKAKDFIPASKPRNFVAKNQKTAGAGAHKDKKRAEKQGDVKHKAKQYDEGFFGDLFKGTTTKTKSGQMQTYAVYDGFSIYYDPEKELFVTAGTGEYKDKFRAKGFADTGNAIFYGEQMTGSKRQQPIKINREVGAKQSRYENVPEAAGELNPGEDTHYFRVRHQTKRDIELEMPPKAWDAVGPAYATYEEAKEAFEQLKAKHPNERFTYTQHPRISHMGGVAKRVFPEEANMEARDPEDWDEGNTEPPNNFAVYINGKKWKVFKGRGYYADDERERQHYYQLKDWAAKKTAATGKKWEVSITGEPATE